MRKYIALLMAALLAVFPLAACGGGQQEEAAEEETQTEEEVGWANPWSDVDTAEEAAKGAGIDSFSILVEVTAPQDSCSWYPIVDGKELMMPNGGGMYIFDLQFGS